VRIVLTRAAGGNDELARRLRAEDHDPVVCPLVRVEALGDDPVRAEGYDWVIVTSRHRVVELVRRLEGGLPRVAAIGRGTAAALRDHGIEPALVPRVSTQEGLAAELPRRPGRVLFTGAEGARDVLVRELGADFVPLYRTVELEPAELPDAELAVLASASAARALARLTTELPCVSIGPVTSAEALARGLDVVAEAPTQDSDGLLQAIKLAASQARSSRS
jgi:uroporphyrinogen III methyltransferase / synthase